MAARSSVFVEAIRDTGAICNHTAVIFYYDIFTDTVPKLADQGVALQLAVHLVGRAGRGAQPAAISNRRCWTRWKRFLTDPDAWRAARAPA